MNSRVFIPALLIVSSLTLVACSTSTPNEYGQAKLNFAEQNYHDAYQQLLVPAAKGNPEAEYALGFLYYYGKGTPQNHDLGKQWILKAAKDGNEQAARAYQMIMSQEQSIMPASAVATKQIYHPKIVRHPKAVEKMLTHKHHRRGVKLNKTTSAQHSLLSAKPTDYTLQLLEASSARYAQDFINKYKLGSQAHYFHRQLKGKNLYVIVYGEYHDRDTSLKAIQQLPKAIQKLHPWARQLAGIQAEIRSA